MEAMRIAWDVEDAMIRAQGGYVNGLKFNPSGARSIGSVVRSEPNRTTTTQPGRTKSVGSVRRDGFVTHANARVS